jgi:lipid-binding SYLF domain-containing protein
MFVPIRKQLRGSVLRKKAAERQKVEQSSTPNLHTKPDGRPSRRRIDFSECAATPAAREDILEIQHSIERSFVMKVQRMFVGSVALLAAMVLALGSTGWAADDTNDTKGDQSDIQKRIEKSADVLNEIMGTPDKAIPDKVMSDAKCIAVVPSMVRIAIGFGGSHGKGIATCRTSRGWSAPAPITITGGSWGLQLGGEAVDLVMVITNDQGMQHLLSSKFKLGADASAAAGPVGRDAGADTDWKMKAEVLTYSRARGVFAGIDLSGSAITQDKDETRVLYGREESFDSILNGRVHAPAAAQSFLSTVRKYSTQARQQGSLTEPAATESAAQ